MSQPVSLALPESRSSSPSAAGSSDGKSARPCSSEVATQRFAAVDVHIRIGHRAAVARLQFSTGSFCFGLPVGCTAAFQLAFKAASHSAPAAGTFVRLGFTLCHRCVTEVRRRFTIPAGGVTASNRRGPDTADPERHAVATDTNFGLSGPPGKLERFRNRRRRPPSFTPGMAPVVHTDLSQVPTEVVCGAFRLTRKGLFVRVKSVEDVAWTPRPRLTNQPLLRKDGGCHEV